MMEIMIETLIMAFLVGGIFSVITAAQRNTGAAKAIPVKIEHNSSYRRR